MMFFWGGIGLLCASLAFIFATVSLGQTDTESPLWLLFMVVFVSGFTLRRVAKRSMRSVEQGGDLQFDLLGRGVTRMLERRAPVTGTPSLGTAEPEPGLRRHVVMGDGILIASAAILITIALITLVY